MEKCVPFDKYREMERLMPGASSSKVFEAAWKRTPDGIKHQRNMKIVRSIAISLVVGTVVSNALAIIPFAGVDEIVALKDSDPAFFGRIKSSFQTYEDIIGIFNSGHDKEMFLKVMEKSFTDFELLRIVELFKGSKLEEIIKVLPTLFIR